MGDRNSLDAFRCAGCNHEFVVGDLYIEDTASSFTKTDSDTGIDSLIAGIFGSSDTKVRFCEDCTEDGGGYRFKTFHGDEGES